MAGTEKFSRDFALQLDSSDPLKNTRKLFQLDDPGLIYLDGNSLGVLPLKSMDHIANVVSQEWGSDLIRSWNKGWYERAHEAGAKIARLIGARPDEVVVTDSTSVNLFKLAYAALDFQKNRNGIVSDEMNFPSDLYILQGLVDMFGKRHQLRLAGSEDDISISMEALENAMAGDTALLTLSLVQFKSAFMYDMKAVTELAHNKGALVLWDLSHATGAVPVDLNGCNADLAIGCTYKYLNGGPGAPAFLYVRRDLQEKLRSPIWGWFGQQNPFSFDLDYTPAEGISRFLAGTPPIVSLSALDASLDILLDAGMEAIREKSIRQGQYLIDLLEYYLSPLDFSLGSPTDHRQRGSHISIRHCEAYRICQALIHPEKGNRVVIPDFREPDNIRLGITPLYTSFTDLYDAVMEIREIVSRGIYSDFSSSREKVT